MPPPTYLTLHRFIQRQKAQRILVVGDGDLAFTLILYRNTLSRGRLSIDTSTVLSKEQHMRLRRAARIYKKLQNLRVPVHFDLDATRLDQTVMLPHYNMVIWCYPFPESNQPDALPTLLSRFFNAAYRKGVQTVLLGLKSLVDEPDHQFNRLHLHLTRYRLGEKLQLKPFWKPMHVSGRPLDNTTNRYITFFAFHRV